MLTSTPWNGSYKIGFDDRFSLSQIYFFTFYTEFRDEGGRWLGWLEAGLLGTLLLASLLSNALLGLALLRAGQRSHTNAFTWSLWSADILFALSIPPVIVSRLQEVWSLGPFLCRLLPYSQLVCGFMILWSLTFLSVERYHCLSLQPRLLPLTVSSTGLLMTGMWLFGLLLFSPVLLWFRSEPSLGICSLVFPKAPPFKVSLLFTSTVIILACLLPMAILVYNYHKIYLKMVESRDRWSVSSSPQSSSLTRQERQRIRKHIRIMRLVLLNVTVVLLMWLPVAGVLILIYLDSDRSIGDTNFFLRSHHLIGALGLALLNTAVNPLLWSGGRLGSLACCSSSSHNSQSTPSLSKLLRIGSSGN